MRGEGGAPGAPPDRTATTLLEDRRGRTMRLYGAGRKLRPAAGTGGQDQRGRQSHGGVGFFADQRPTRWTLASNSACSYCAKAGAG